jgi:GNAT superfamily N-acetyltransferase
MYTENENDFMEIEIALNQIIVVQSEEYFNDYFDNYVRKHHGPIRLVRGEPERIEEIGEIELWYIDGSRALDNGLDIIDLCDSFGQEEYEYASAIYSGNMIESSLIEEPMSNDVLLLQSLVLYPEYRGKRYGLQITRKIIETIGYHCGAVLLKPAPLQFSSRSENKEWMERMEMSQFPTDPEEATQKLINYWNAFDLRRTRDPEIFYIAQF